MPFLFIDYDQGAGGEFFAAKLSQSDQCVTLVSEQFANNRTKAYDKFDQEFLNIPPVVDRKLDSDPILYDIVLSHQNTALAKQLLDNVHSLRITSPRLDEELYKFYVEQRLKKIFLSKLPGKTFVGEVKILARNSVNPNFIKEVKSNMDTLDLILLSKNITPTKENRDTYINGFINNEEQEPDFNYDLVIPYRDLFYGTDHIRQAVADVFGIQIIGDWLDTYRKTYEAWLSEA